MERITSEVVSCSETNSNPQTEAVFPNGSEANEHHCSHSICIGLPASPSKFIAERAKKVFFTSETDTDTDKNAPFDAKIAAIHSQSMLYTNDATKGSETTETNTISADVFNTLKKSDNQPLLLRIPISSFGVCLGVGSQVILWKTLATSPSTRFLHVSLSVNFGLWCMSLALVASISVLYILKIVFYFEAVRREYYHPIRVNFFFAPWIALLFIAIGAPPSIEVKLPSPLWYVLMAPILCLELKIYGQWMAGGQRRLSKVANPSNHLSIIGNFVGALLGSSMGLKEGPLFFFAVGLAHYTVLFVTLYQRLPTNQTLPKELHPMFFLFVGAPSVACVAWEKIIEEFYIGARITYFITMFLYISLAVRINFFRGFRFSLAWWAYTFPMTSASISTIRYANEVKNPFTQSLSVAMSSISIVTVVTLILLTIYHAFVLQDLFPNDMSIAVANQLSNTRKGQARDIEEGLLEDDHFSL